MQQDQPLIDYKQYKLDRKELAAKCTRYMQTDSVAKKAASELISYVAGALGIDFDSRFTYAYKLPAMQCLAVAVTVNDKELQALAEKHLEETHIIDNRRRSLKGRNHQRTESTKEELQRDIRYIGNVIERLRSESHSETPGKLRETKEHLKCWERRSKKERRNAIAHKLLAFEGEGIVDDPKILDALSDELLSQSRGQVAALTMRHIAEGHGMAAEAFFAEKIESEPTSTKGTQVG